MVWNMRRAQDAMLERLGQVRPAPTEQRPLWDDLPPIERAIDFPGRCCDCGASIPLAAIRCKRHEYLYQSARAK